MTFTKTFTKTLKTHPQELLVMTAHRAAAIAGALAVAIGAFGAHALEARLESLGRGATWDTASLYHLIHALALLIAASRAEGRARTVALVAFWVGLVAFSGALYALALTGATWLGAVAPIGGTGFIVGWMALAASAPCRPQGAVPSS